MDDDDTADAIQPMQDHRPFGYVLTNLNYYSPREWAQIKRAQHRTWLGIHVVSVYDEPGQAAGRDPVAVIQAALGWGLMAVLMAVLGCLAFAILA